jgi:transposase
MHLSDTTVRRWSGRFNEQGLDGLLDQPRPGAPRQYAPEVRARVLATARTKPTELGLPFASWTMDRLHT